MIDENGNPRETGSKMLHYEMLLVRPDTKLPNEEARLKVKILPLRLHIDQDAFDFLRWFFTYESPIAAQKAKMEKAGPRPKPVEPTFFQQVDISSISLKVDYKPKVLDVAGFLAEGKIEELGNIFRLEGSEVHLVPVKLNGLKGWNRLLEGAINAWKPHFKSMIPGIASGLAPVRSLVNVGSAALDLLVLPFQQYQKDGRFVYGLQKAASTFLKTATVETMNLSTKILVGTQVILVAADDMVDPSKAYPENAATNLAASSSTASINSMTKPPGGKKNSIYAHQPATITEGLQQGYQTLSDNMKSAAWTLFRVPVEAYEQKGAQEAMKTMFFSVPSAILKPAIGLTQAASKTLMGARNTLSPATKRELDEKYGE